MSETKNTPKVKTAKPTEKTAKPAAVETKKTEQKNESTNPWEVLLHPHLAEKSMSMVESKNTLTFIVSPFATKKQVAEAVSKGFNVDVAKVNIEITQRSQKKAYVRLGKKHSAADIATRLGMI